MQDVYSGDTIISHMLDRIKGSARVETIYGEPREVGGKTVIPVAKVEYAFGAGGGASELGTGNGSKVPTGSGGGGGGAVRVRPVGVLEVTADETRLVPVIDWTRVITTAIVLTGAWMIVRAVFRRGK